MTFHDFSWLSPTTNNKETFHKFFQLFWADYKKILRNCFLDIKCILMSLAIILSHIITYEIVFLVRIKKYHTLYYCKQILPQKRFMFVVEVHMHSACILTIVSQIPNHILSSDKYLVYTKVCCLCRPSNTWAKA